MKCFKCKKADGSIELGHFPGKICKNCFLKTIEKRVRKEVRINKLFSKNDRILVLDDGSENAAVTNYLLPKIIRYLKPEIEILTEHDSTKPIKKGRKVVIPWNLDDEIQDKLGQMFTRLESKKDTRIKLLRNVSKQEVELFATLKGLKFRRSEPINPEIGLMLDKLSKEHPDIKFALLKSFEKIGI